MKNISRDTFKTIKEKKIIPKPKWRFLLEEYFIWGTGAISLIIGSLAAAVVIYMLDNNDWDLYQNISNNLLSFIFTTLPYFWIVILILFALVVYYNFKHTKGGYKYKLSTVAIVSVLISLILGFLFYNIGLAKIIDDAFTDIPIYERIMHYRQSMWMQTDKGLLGGVVVSITDKNNFVIKDLDNKIWYVNTDDTIVKERLEIKQGIRIKIIGERIDENNFKAFRIRPFIDGKGCLMNRCKMHLPYNKINERKMF